MKNKRLTLFSFLFFVIGFIQCQKKTTEISTSNSIVKSSPIESEAKPTRVPYEGFEWEKISGAGITFWSQKSKTMQIGISETLPGAFLEKIENGQPIALATVIQVFDLPNQKIEDVLIYLQDDERWQASEGCAFTKINSERNGVERYVLQPTGKALETFQKTSAEEPVTHTCCVWGQGNSGIRYFEIHDTNPNKAIFLEIGQEAPLFDENSIVVHGNTTVK